MKKIKLVFVGIFILVILLTSTVSAEEHIYRYIFPLGDGWEYDDVSTDEFIVLNYSWATISPGLVNAYIKRAEQSFTLTGLGYPSLSVAPEEAKLLWGAIFPFDLTPYPHWQCPPVKSGAVANWQYEIGYLEEGVYTLQFDRILEPPITDACDGDGDGRPDKYYSSDSTLTIIVNPLP